MLGSLQRTLIFGAFRAGTATVEKLLGPVYREARTLFLPRLPLLWFRVVLGAVLD